MKIQIEEQISALLQMEDGNGRVEVQSARD